MRRWLIRFTSGREETIDGYNLVGDHTVLQIRTTESIANAQYVTYTLANVESYREVTR